MILFGRERVLWTYLVVLVLLLQVTMRASCRLDVVNQRTVLESENENIILLPSQFLTTKKMSINKNRRIFRYIYAHVKFDEEFEKNI